MTKLEAMLLRLEQKIDDKENTLFHKRKEAQNKVQYLKKNLNVSWFAKLHYFDKIETVLQNRIHLEEQICDSLKFIVL